MGLGVGATTWQVTAEDTIFAFCGPPQDRDTAVKWSRAILPAWRAVRAFAKGEVQMKHVIKALLLGAWALWSAVAVAAVDANTANAADLDSVKGIGPGTSNRIMEARKAGPFKDWNDFVDRVRGIGPGNAAKLSDNGLTVNGQTFKATVAKAPDKPTSASKNTPEPNKKP